MACPVTRSVPPGPNSPRTGKGAVTVTSTILRSPEGTRETVGVHVATPEGGVGEDLHPLARLGLRAPDQCGSTSTVARGVGEDVPGVDPQGHLEERHEHDDDKRTDHDEVDDGRARLVVLARAGASRPGQGATSPSEHPEEGHSFRSHWSPSRWR